MSLLVRTAVEADLPALRSLMALAIDALQVGFLTPEQIVASRAVMGLDTQLVTDGTYLVVEEDGVLAGCGGWSRRATLYGGDHSRLRDPAPLDPTRDAARIRAMYTHPAFARRGIGRMILAACEAAATSDGFSRLELMGTLSGAPLYRACGYEVIEAVEAEADGIKVPLLRMGKTIPR